MVKIFKRIGNGYIGTDDVKTSNANEDIIPSTPQGWSIGYHFYKFSFINKQPCHVKINGGEQIFLDSNQGIDTDVYDALINSFVIVESGIEYQFIGAY